MTPLSLDRVLDAVVRVDEHVRVTYVSEPGLNWFGIDNTELFPGAFHDLIARDDVKPFLHLLATRPETFNHDLRLLRQGNEHWVHVRGYRLPDGHQYMLCLLDISGWKTDDASLRHAADHDELTGLANRTTLKRTVEALIRDGRKPFSIALLDLDGFKRVNDTFGHGTGDAVLTETALRLRKVISPHDLLARLGGDEFVIILQDTDAEAAAERLNSVLLAIARPFNTAPHNAYLGVSIGVAQHARHGEDYSSLLKNADTAMYLAKNSGKNRVCIYAEPKDNVDFSIKAAIHSGIHEGEFFLEFQPQYDTQRRLIGAEALMRWTSRQFGRVGPDKFIPIVEESGLMPFLGKWALRYACHQLRQFHALMPDFVMSVNVSPIQFGSEQFDRQVLDVIEETQINPVKLVLEITESTLMNSHEQTERALTNLREEGIRFSIDDFGTGFSSLAYLTRLPVSSIKIDRAFIRAIEDSRDQNTSDHQLVNAMIRLAQNIDLKVVAEGVEKEEQLAFLTDSGCNHFQGYLLSRPVSAATLTGLLQQAA